MCVSNDLERGIHQRHYEAAASLRAENGSIVDHSEHFQNGRVSSSLPDLEDWHTPSYTECM